MAARKPIVIIDGQLSQLDTLNDTLDANIYHNNVLDFTEAAQDSVAQALTNSSTIVYTYDDTGNTITSEIRLASITDDHVNLNAGIQWDKISKAGSNLTEIVTRNHNDLQNVDGGSATERFHLTSDQHTDLTDGGDATTQHHHDSRYYTKVQLDSDGVLDVRYYTKTQLQTAGQSQVHWDNVTDKPATYPPSSHSHVSTDITDFDEAAQDAVGAAVTSTVTITPVYDDVNNQLRFNINNDSITAALIAANVDVSNKGFNADKIDGADLDDTGTSSSVIWSAAKIIDYVSNNSGGNTAHAVLDKDLCSPPSSPSDGDRYIVCANSSSGSASGDWAGHENDIAEWNAGTSSWDFTTPDNGLRVWVDDENANYTWDSNDSQWYKSGGGTNDHNALLNLQGGDGVDEFYHLTDSQHSMLVSGPTTSASSIHNHDRVISSVDGSTAIETDSSGVKVNKDTDFDQHVVTGVPDPNNDFDAVNKRTLDNKQHNSLQGLQGGTSPNQYYHLSEFDYDVTHKFLHQYGEVNRYFVYSGGSGVFINPIHSLSVLGANGLYLHNQFMGPFNHNVVIVLDSSLTAVRDFGKTPKYSWLAVLVTSEPRAYLTYCFRVYDLVDNHTFRLAHHTDPGTVVQADELGWDTDMYGAYPTTLLVTSGQQHGMVMRALHNSTTGDATVTVDTDLGVFTQPFGGSWLVAGPAVLTKGYRYLSCAFHITNGRFLRAQTFGHKTIAKQSVLAHVAQRSRQWYTLDAAALAPPTAVAFDSLIVQPYNRNFIAQFSTDSGNTLCRGSCQFRQAGSTYNSVRACVTQENIPLKSNGSDGVNYYHIEAYLQRSTRLYTAGWIE